MKYKLNTAVVVLIMVFVLFLCILAGLGMYLMQKSSEKQSMLSGLETRYSRMLGLKVGANELDRAEAAIAPAIAQYAYASSQDATQVGNDAQQRVRSLFTGAGLEVASIQILPVVAKKNFDQITINVRFEGSLTSLQSAMVILESQKPKVFVDNYSTQTVGVVKAEAPQRLSGQFNVYVLRQRS